jgi:hypothetical protein
MLRNACYVLVVALSLMRDSEKRAELHQRQCFPRITECGTSTNAKHSFTS